MGYYLTKLILSAALIVLVSEISKRYATVGGLLASLPLVSFLAMIWLYIDTHDVTKVSALSWSIFWLVIPSLTFFIALPLLLKKLPFALSMALATIIMVGCYSLMMLGLRKMGVNV
ncbi:MAG: hypothetical protein GC164_11635 [Phycisphaera sp.]|nr:hypothetical protein [Phycisphaera sp.]